MLHGPILPVDDFVELLRVPLAVFVFVRGNCERGCEAVEVLAGCPGGIGRGGGSGCLGGGEGRSQKE